MKQAELKPLPSDPIFGVLNQYKNDSSKHKVNLVVGAYRDDNERPWVLPCVRLAEEKIIAQTDYDKEYLPMSGTEKFKQSTQRILFEEEWLQANKNRVITTQSLSGTGALRIGTEFLKRTLKGKKLYLPNLTWANHMSICEDSSIEWSIYPYYNQHTKSLDIDKLKQFLKNLDPRSIVLLHAVAHNPTGVDPSQQEWIEILQIFKERNHLAFFDCAYQGFASGDIDRDGFVIKLWAKEGLEMMIAQSFSKSFGLYNERIGAFHIVTCPEDVSIIPNAQSYCDRIVRAMYSSPPSHGALIIETIMTNPELEEQWKSDLITMSTRLYWCRKALYDELIRLKTPGNWDFIVRQIGMFTFTGLTEQQVLELVQKYHIYLLKNGRISLTGVNTHNVAYIAQSIHNVVTGQKKSSL